MTYVCSRILSQLISLVLLIYDLFGEIFLLTEIWGILFLLNIVVIC